MFDMYDLLDALSELVFVTELETCELLYMNKAAKEFCGDCKGKRCYDAFHGDKEVCDYCSVQQLSDDEFIKRPHINKINGKVFVFRDKLVNWNGKNARLTISTDITQQNELEQRLKREHFIVSCIVELHKTKDINSAINGLLALTGKFFGADRAYVFNCDDETVSNTHEWCKEGVTPEIDNLQGLDISVIDRWQEPFSARRCVILENIDELREISPQEYECLAPQGVNSLIVSPLEGNGKLIGFMGIDNPASENLYENEVYFEALSYFVSSMLLRNVDESVLRNLSYTDNLTKIYNRNRFIEDINIIMESDGKGVGVVYTDLNGLKAINDHFGHYRGDLALKTIASILVKTFGKTHSYRVGGDEFVALYPCDDEGRFKNLVEQLKRQIDDIEYNAAIGYQFSNDCRELYKIVKIADENMYLDKKYFYRNQKDSTRYRFRNDTFTAISTPELLKNLIDEERFVIWFQPRFTAKTNEFCGSEALIRFFDEDDVLVSPMDFVPEMEENHTIHLIDFYVFRHVCEYISGWLKEGKNVKPVSVNMSHKTMLHSGFMENLMNIWYDYNIPKELIIIEVSESASNGISDVVSVLSELKKRGFQIAIDNFGAKYADLYLFTELKFDILKLDRDLVYKIENDDKTRLLSESIAQICHNEEIKLIAEGVENEKELQKLIEIGCDEAQGYLFDKPMSWNWFEKKYLK